MIQGKNVLLIPLEKDDLKLTIQWLNNPEIGLPLGKFKEFNLRDSLKWYDENVATNKIVIYKIVAEGTHIGNITLDNFVHHDRIAKLSLYIGEKDYWGRGYARDASIVMLKYGFQKLHLHKIYLKVFTNNSRAINIYESLGFKKEGILRKEQRISEHEYVDVIYMGLFESELRED